MACVLVLGQFAHAEDLIMGDMNVNKILFLGNSITFSPGPILEIGWEGNWGMAASAVEKDYVHLLTSAVATEAGGVPTTMVSNIADDFERSYTNPGYDVNVVFASQLAFEADVVILQIAENIGSSLDTETDKALFEQRLGELLTALKGRGQPEIFVTSGIMNANAIKDQIKQTLCAAMDCVFVDLNAFRADPLHYAYSDAYQTFSPEAYGSGVTIHPGDTGMAMIADTVYREMVAHSTPEPVTMGLLIAGGLGMLIRKNSNPVSRHYE